MRQRYSKNYKWFY